MKEHQVSDLFYTSWKELSAQAQSEVFALQQQALNMDKAKPDYGFVLIQILRRLRKNPSLVNKINEAQAVDIYNDLVFLNKPWYYFPKCKLSLRLKAPKPEMAESSFDHFIHADNEFTKYLITKEPIYLKRLMATLYQKRFDKEKVEPIAAKIKYPDWFLHLVFFTYAHVRTSVMKRCKTLLPSSAVSEDSQPVPSGGMWYKIKHAAARTGVFGTFDQTGAANMYSVLDHLELIAQERDAKS